MKLWPKKLGGPKKSNSVVSNVFETSWSKESSYFLVLHLFIRKYLDLWISTQRGLLREFAPWEDTMQNFSSVLTTDSATCLLFTHSFMRLISNYVRKIDNRFVCKDVAHNYYRIVHHVSLAGLSSSTSFLFRFATLTTTAKQLIWPCINMIWA